MRLELNELQFYTGLKIKKIKKLNENINNFDGASKNTITMWEDDAVQNNYELKSKKKKFQLRRLRYPPSSIVIPLSI